MTLRTRRLIYSMFIAIFLLCVPLIILYTLGYRYNFEKNKIQKTGIFILKSEPEKALIFLNEKLQKEKTPARIINLLPNDYLVKVEKENFYSWQKKLTIQSHFTTFAENIFLFEKNQPKKIMDGNIFFFSLSPNNRDAIFIEEKTVGKELWYIDLGDYNTNLLYRLPPKTNETINVEWSADGQKIVINQATTEKYIVLDIKTNNASVYDDLSFFYSSFREIKNKLLEPKNLDDFTFIKSPSSFTTTLNKKNKDITVFSNETGNIVWQEKAELARWSPDENKILYLKNLELWIYDFSKNNSTLVTRDSQKIKDIFWINDDYILILVGNTLKSIELEDRDARNVTNLLSENKIKNVALDSDEQKIYFTIEAENEKGIFELSY